MTGNSEQQAQLLRMEEARRKTQHQLQMIERAKSPENCAQRTR
jgi:hypothetical protein